MIFFWCLDMDMILVVYFMRICISSFDCKVISITLELLSFWMMVLCVTKGHALFVTNIQGKTAKWFHFNTDKKDFQYKKFNFTASKQYFRWVHFLNLPTIGRCSKKVILKPDNAVELFRMKLLSLCSLTHTISILSSISIILRTYNQCKDKNSPLIHKVPN